MISGKLIHLVESNWERIVTRVIAQIRSEPRMPHTRAQLESELRDRGQSILENLGYWLSSANEAEVARWCEELGQRRFRNDVPLHEAVRALCIIRAITVDFVEEHVIAKTTLELYEEEELDRRLGRFFDLMIIHLVAGYEQAMRSAATAHA